VQFNVSKIYRWHFGMRSVPNMGNKPPNGLKKKLAKEMQNKFTKMQK